MLIRPRLRSQLLLKQHRLRLATLRWRHDYATFRFVLPGQLGSRKFVGVFATFAIHEPFVYVEPRTWTISGESRTHGNKRILQDPSNDLVRLWGAQGGAPTTLGNGPTMHS